MVLRAYTYNEDEHFLVPVYTRTLAKVVRTSFDLSDILVRVSAIRRVTISSFCASICTHRGSYVRR